MKKLVFFLGCLVLCCQSVAYAQAGGQCGSGRCGSPEFNPSGNDFEVRRVALPTRGPIPSQDIQYPRCAPGECYLFEELVKCTSNDYSCQGGFRRIWSYRPQFYRIDNSELLTNLHKKLCPDSKNCKWPYTMENSY